MEVRTLARLPRLQLAHSGLAVIGIILICESIYLVVFSWELDRTDKQVKQALAQYARIATVSDSMKLFYQANASLLAYALTNRTKVFADSYYQTMRALKQQRLELAEVRSSSRSAFRTTSPGVTQSPSADRTEALRKSVMDGLSGSMRAVEESPGFIQFTNIESVRQLESVQKNTDQLIKRFVSEVEQDLALDANSLQKQLQQESEAEGRVRSNIILGFVLNVGLALLLVVFWVKQVAGRIELLQKNADRLGRGDALLPMKGGEDELAELELVLQDVTRRRKQTAELKAEFVTFLSEDLTNTLKNIESILSQGETGKLGLNEKGRHSFTRSLTSSRRLERLIKELLYVYEAESETPAHFLQEVDLASVLKSAVEEVAALAASSSVALELSAEPLQVKCDPDKIQQVTINLLSNAIKYSSTGMTVQIRLLTESTRAIVQVDDQGPGIPAEFQEKLFQRYEQAKTARKGTGLGLFICQKVIIQHGGEIGAENLPGAGARFWFTLPS